MEIALTIFAVIAAWIGGIWSDFDTWCAQPATNGIIVLAVIMVIWGNYGLQKQIEAVGHMLVRGFTR